MPETTWMESYTNPYKALQQQAFTKTRKTRSKTKYGEKGREIKN